MLVLSLTKDANGRLHPINRWEERAVQPERLLMQVIAEINLYLPDDWRMTSGATNWQVDHNRTNKFRIDVRLDEPKTQVAFVGKSYRVRKTEVLHIVDTVLNAEYFSKQIFKDIVEELGVTFETSDDETKAKYGEVFAPNLYFFSPCPDDSASPLFARQYERIKYLKGKKVGAQYHRIHALTKGGVDSDHYRWVLWNTDGDVRPVGTPSDDFHAKSYWGTPTLAEAGQVRERNSFENKYRETYRDLLEANNIQVVQPEHKPYLLYETEFKFCLKAPDKTTFADIQQEVAQAIRKAGANVSSGNCRNQEDTYFDDESFTLLNSGVSFRLRKKSDNLRVTLKKRFPQEPYGVYKRIEEEVAISESHEKDLRAGQPIPALPYRLLAYVAPGSGSLKAVVVVKNLRTTHSISDRFQRHAELCFDEVTFVTGDRQEGPYYEIEIESKGIASDELVRLAGLMDGLGLLRSSESKYERAMAILARH